MIIMFLHLLKYASLQDMFSPKNHTLQVTRPWCSSTSHMAMPYIKQKIHCKLYNNTLRNIIKVKL